jgi:hypothetical protein
MKISCGEMERHDHACVLFDADEEFIVCATSLVRRGVAARERCIVITDEIPAERIRKHLALLDLRPQALEAEGSLCFGRFRDFYLPGGIFSPSATVHGALQAIRTALKAGYAGVRGIAELGPSLRDIPFADFLAYEAAVQELFFQCPVSGLCAYRRDCVEESRRDSVIEIHPFQIIKTLNFS